MDAGRAPGLVEYDLHGLIGIRLVGPTEDYLAALDRVVGREHQQSLTREPDVTVRFVDSLPTGTLTVIRNGRIGFSDEGFFVRSGRRRAGWVRYPMDRIGQQPCELIAERGRSTIPLLVDLLRVIAVGKGVAPLHAAAFEYRGTGIIATGMPHGGKTSALMGFIQRGASFISDDLVLLDPAGNRMLGIGSSVELTAWQAEQVSQFRGPVRSVRRVACWAARRLTGEDDSTNSREGYAGIVRRSMGSMLERKLRVQFPRVALPAHPSDLVSRPEKLFLMMVHHRADVRVEEADPESILARIIQLGRSQGHSLLEHYVAFQFAFPGLRNELLDRVQELEAGILRDALSNVDVYIVFHPRPVSLDRLCEAMLPYCSSGLRDVRTTSGRACALPT